MNDIERDLKKVKTGLKDFQWATVQHVFNGLFGRPRGRMLVADEVGLGKTIVAKGVIAEAVRRHLSTSPNRPLRVAYICSNQAIAHENQQKLQVFKEEKGAPMYGRIAELAYAPANIDNRVLEINTLTPSTSFSVTQGAGNWVERMVLYRLLQGFFPAFKSELKEWLRFGVGEESWESKLASDRGRNPLRLDMPGRFRVFLALGQATLSDHAARQLHSEQSFRVCLWKAVEILLQKMREKENPDSAMRELRILLRRALIECCIDYIEADLFILDEFQRFPALLREDEESEEARIAKRIFSKPEARILLLSATPFKAYSRGDDQETDEAHHKELQKVLSFLTKDRPGDLLEFEAARRDIYSQIARLGSGALQPEELCEKPKKKLENLLVRYICRTERAIAAGSGNLMVKDIWRQKSLPLSRADIETFRCIDQLAVLLAQKDLAGKRAAGIVEYAKAAAFPMSFLDGYQFKEVLRKHHRNPAVQKVLSKTRCAWLNESEINGYSLNLSKPNRGSDGGGNARLQQLVDEAIGDKGHLLLWVPPSLPSYQLSGPFSGQGRFSKTLVFSAWQLVPKMIGTMISYEVERRTIGSDKKIKLQDRKYFHGEKQRRNPQPQLQFKTTSGNPAAMSLFSLLYPCIVLAELVDAEIYGDAARSFEDVKRALADKIAKLLEAAGLQAQSSIHIKTHAWYWYAPFCLDESGGWGDSMKIWAETEGGLSALKQSNQDKSGLQSHFQKLKQSLELGGISLGDFPSDLPEQLAVMALGSPAVACLRSLQRIYPDLPTQNCMEVASQFASGFLELFNKPEAISAVRPGKGGGFFWQKALRYGAQGCIHAMVDEYLHMLADQEGSLEKVKVRFLNSINMFTTSVNVESLQAFTKGNKKGTKPKKMRCHYAVDMGNQKIETEVGQQRVINIRESFNSPFRPFVLASTSIGQEGLDFHWYCRRIVHWNLPGNPIDLEQREGRINRYKSLVIRRRIAARFGQAIRGLAPRTDVWSHLMNLAETETSRVAGCQLKPFWLFDDSDGAEYIERLVPLYPLSRDADRLSHILKVLTLYRLTFGQPRQDELLDFLLKQDFTPEEITLIKKKLLINLSPFALKSNAMPDFYIPEASNLLGPNRHAVVSAIDE